MWVREEIEEKHSFKTAKEYSEEMRDVGGSERDCGADLAGTESREAAIIECVLFASGEPVSPKKLAEILECGVRDVRRAISLLKERYEKSGLEILETGEGIRLTTKKRYSVYIDRLFSNQKRRGLSNAALEVLAIIALRQPVTKAEIEEMRGVSADSLVQQLIRKDLIYCSGKLDKLGSPSHYSTTPKFLEVFELESLDQLPTLDDLRLL